MNLYLLFDLSRIATNLMHPKKFSIVSRNVPSLFASTSISLVTRRTDSNGHEVCLWLNSFCDI